MLYFPPMSRDSSPLRRRDSLLAHSPTWLVTLAVLPQDTYSPPDWQ